MAALWAAPSPACTQRLLSPPVSQARAPATSCLWRMPQVARGALLQPQRGLREGLSVGPDLAPASFSQHLRLPSRQSWGPGWTFRVKGCAAQQPSAAPLPPLQPAVPLTESRDSHNYWDYKERIIDLQPALCDQRPGGPPGPPLLL